MRLTGGVAIVTGGGRGIGRGIAVALAREGASIVVASRTGSELDETVNEVKGYGGQCLAVVADVSRPNEVAHLVSKAVEAFGTVDVLVNNAGIQGPTGLLIDNDVDHWIRTVHGNLVATFLCMRATLPHMIGRHRGKIINLSGGGAATPRPRFSAYAASKAAIVRLTETTAEEVRPFNVQVNAIAPGLVKTRMVEELMAAGEAVGAAAEQSTEDVNTAIGRVQELAVFLASTDSDGVTGKLISAVHDEWGSWNANAISILGNSVLYTLRRADPFVSSTLTRDLQILGRR